jgi:hypothetical protein
MRAQTVSMARPPAVKHQRGGDISPRRMRGKTAREQFTNGIDPDQSPVN